MNSSIYMYIYGCVCNVYLVFGLVRVYEDFALLLLSVVLLQI